MRKKTLLLVSLLAFVAIGSGCAKWIEKGESITAVGSSALQPLVESAAETFAQKNPGKLSTFKVAVPELGYHKSSLVLFKSETLICLRKKNLVLMLKN